MHIAVVSYLRIGKRQATEVCLAIEVCVIDQSLVIRQFAKQRIVDDFAFLWIIYKSSQVCALQIPVRDIYRLTEQATNIPVNMLC